MITDEQVEASLNYLRDNARKAAQASAERMYMVEFRKVVKSTLMRERMMDSLGSQESFAYSDPRYGEHLKAMKAAIEADEYYRWMRVSAEAKVNAWQTQSANDRALGKFK